MYRVSTRVCTPGGTRECTPVCRCTRVYCKYLSTTLTTRMHICAMYMYYKVQ